MHEPLRYVTSNRFRFSHLAYAAGAETVKHAWN